MHHHSGKICKSQLFFGVFITFALGDTLCTLNPSQKTYETVNTNSYNHSNLFILCVLTINHFKLIDERENYNLYFKMTKCWESKKKKKKKKIDNRENLNFYFRKFTKCWVSKNNRTEVKVNVLKLKDYFFNQCSSGFDCTTFHKSLESSFGTQK